MWRRTPVTATASGRAASNSAGLLPLPLTCIPSSRLQYARGRAALATGHAETAPTSWHADTLPGAADALTERLASSSSASTSAQSLSHAKFTPTTIATATTAAESATGSSGSTVDLAASPVVILNCPAGRPRRTAHLLVAMAQASEAAAMCHALGAGRKLCVVLLAPTTELVSLLYREARELGRSYGGLAVQLVHGGSSVASNLTALRTCPDVLIATPGRLLQLLTKHGPQLQHIFAARNTSPSQSASSSSSSSGCGSGGIGGAFGGGGSGGYQARFAGRGVESVAEVQAARLLVVDEACHVMGLPLMRTTLSSIRRLLQPRQVLLACHALPRGLQVEAEALALAMLQEQGQLQDRQGQQGQQQEQMQGQGQHWQMQGQEPGLQQGQGLEQMEHDAGMQHQSVPSPTSAAGAKAGPPLVVVVQQPLQMLQMLSSSLPQGPAMTAALRLMGQPLATAATPATPAAARGATPQHLAGADNQPRTFTAPLLQQVQHDTHTHDRVGVSAATLMAPTLPAPTLRCLAVPGDQVTCQLYGLLRHYAQHQAANDRPLRAIVLCPTAAVAALYARLFRSLGLPSLELHSRLPRSKAQDRHKVLEQFRALSASSALPKPRSMSQASAITTSSPSTSSATTTSSPSTSSTSTAPASAAAPSAPSSTSVPTSALSSSVLPASSSSTLHSNLPSGSVAQAAASSRSAQQQQQQQQAVSAAAPKAVVLFATESLIFGSEVPAAVDLLVQIGPARDEAHLQRQLGVAAALQRCAFEQQQGQQGQRQGKQGKLGKQGQPDGKSTKPQAGAAEGQASLAGGQEGEAGKVQHQALQQQQQQQWQQQQQQQQQQVQPMMHVILASDEEQVRLQHVWRGCGHAAPIPSLSPAPPGLTERLSDAVRRAVRARLGSAAGQRALTHAYVSMLSHTLKAHTSAPPGHTFASPSHVFAAPGASTMAGTSTLASSSSTNRQGINTSASRPGALSREQQAVHAVNLWAAGLLGPSELPPVPRALAARMGLANSPGVWIAPRYTPSVGGGSHSRAGVGVWGKQGRQVVAYPRDRTAAVARAALGLGQGVAQEAGRGSRAGASSGGVRTNHTAA